MLDGEKGYILPYKEVAEKLNLPGGYFLSEIKYFGEEVLLQLIKIEGYASRVGEEIDFCLAKSQLKFFFLKKEEFEKRLGISLKRVSFLFCFNTETGLNWKGIGDEFLIARELLGRENLVWIGEGSPLEKDMLELEELSEFIETDWQ